MAKKLIRAEDILKIKGYDTAALNGTEILSVIGEYYLSHKLSDYILIIPVRFVEYKGMPKSGFLDFTTLDKAFENKETNPELFKGEDSLFGRTFIDLIWDWTHYFLQVEKSQIQDWCYKEWQEDYKPVIIIDQASEKTVIKFIKSIGGYKIEKRGGKYRLSII